VSSSKPIGVTILGLLLVAFAAISILIAILIGAGNALIFDIPQPAWILLAGAAVGVVVSYLAIRIGLGLLREPAEGRRAGEMAVWLGIPVVWLALWGINLLLTEGQDDVSFFWGLIAPAGAFWSAVLVGAALYLRSERVRSYFDQSPISTDPGQ